MLVLKFRIKKLYADAFFKWKIGRVSKSIDILFNPSFVGNMENISRFSSDSSLKAHKNLESKI